MAISLILSKLFASFLDTKIVDQFGNMNVSYFSNIALQPTINMFIYEYTYNMWYKPKYSDIVSYRTDNMTKLLGIGFGFA